ncbi:hypothetical protein Oscil6304_4720 [Oscillatoria acuminata PCC 6304]|uniref:Uncharacterized protein n=1 Tax=Oscillatoria acuminata PCC 6304 TaxID=56110 RepID=K9TQ02_9CYAN|nr:hypothetical protein Oscil6304_4720 [Oscillatoria acuminata PCC 6304]
MVGRKADKARRRGVRDKNEFGDPDFGINTVEFYRLLLE